MSSPNDPNAFPEFRIDQIERYAKRWINTYPVIQIEQIALYRYLRPADSLGAGVTKYALDFVISGCTNIDLKDEALRTLPMEGDDECTTALKEIEHANQPNHHPLFDLAFGDTVYKEKPAPDYFREWIFILRRPVDQLWQNLLKDEPHWILFGSEGEDDREKAVESADYINLQQQSPVPGNFFTKKGSRWHIGFEGQTTEIDNLDGFFYIGYLLEKPGESISCTDLYQGAKRIIPKKVVSPDKVLYSEEKKDQKLYLLGNSEQPISDGKARQQYLEKYKELQNDLQKIADLPENERTPEDKIVEEEIIEELELLKPYLKERTFTDKDKKRFQNNVKRRLDTAYNAIGEAEMKKMAEHLHAKIITDRAFGYRYIGDLKWDITIK